MQTEATNASVGHSCIILNAFFCRSFASFFFGSQHGTTKGIQSTKDSYYFTGPVARSHRDERRRRGLARALSEAARPSMPTSGCARLKLDFIINIQSIDDKSREFHRFPRISMVILRDSCTPTQRLGLSFEPCGPCDFPGSQLLPLPAKVSEFFAFFCLSKL